ncbi:MAG: hypothetical protein EOM30_03005 [Clostridia bacterium]|nr:hypothetical protein [Clostridia bacterium]NLS86120.1 hypothetical protein [Oscillospiraceae bacterium]
MKTKTRYAIVMVLCVLLNEGFYTLALALNLPVWLDTTGTALAAIFLEPAAGMLVGLVNNFYLEISRGDASTLIYYFVTAAEAVIVGNLMRKNGKITFSRFLPTIGLTAVVTSVMVSLITIWRGESKLTFPADIAVCDFLQNIGFPHMAAFFVGPFLVKLLDVAVQGAIVLILCMIMPKKLKNPSDI